MADPGTFPESTKTLGPPTGWDELAHGSCVPLSVWSDGSRCVSLWRLTWRERLSALVFGKCWLHVVGSATQPPVALQVARQIFRRR